MTTLSEVFYVCLVTTASATLIKLATLCFKSKCQECSICGGRMRIIRDITAETEIELASPPQKSPSSKDLGDI